MPIFTVFDYNSIYFWGFIGSIFLSYSISWLTRFPGKRSPSERERFTVVKWTTVPFSLSFFAITFFISLFVIDLSYFPDLVFWFVFLAETAVFFLFFRFLKLWSFTVIGVLVLFSFLCHSSLSESWNRGVYSEKIGSYKLMLLSIPFMNDHCSPNASRSARSRALPIARLLAISCSLPR